MKNLKLLRDEKGISQQKLAEKIGTQQQNINSYEHDIHEPDIHMLGLLADFFDTSIDYLVGHTTNRRKIEPVTPFDLNEDEATIIVKYRRVSPAARASVMSTLDAFINAKD